jgi:glycosyltransferase involved in cell wall biosynthesis
VNKLLWVGDACCDSGFARCTHYTLEGLRKAFDVTVLGINFLGDPHPHPYPIYPAWPGGDIFGTGRLPRILRKVRPHVVVFQNDPWNMPAYVRAVDQTTDVPRPVLIGAVAVDGTNCRGWAMNGLDHAIFWTEFARYEALKGGFTKTSSVIPLGVDLNIYEPGDKRAARRSLDLPEEWLDGFIVGNVARNQPRKRLDLTMRFFANWIKSRQVNDAYLYLHVAPTGDLGYDCDQLTAYHEIRGRVALTQPAVFGGFTEAELAQTYRALDVFLSTSSHEGWNLPLIEAMASEVPTVAGRWAAPAEWAKDAAILISCRPATLPNMLNVFGGEMDEKETISALDALYRSDEKRKTLITRGRLLVEQDRFRWENIAAEFTTEVEKAIYRADAA